MKNFLLLLACCLFTSALFAQQPAANITVKGVVIDSAANKPLDFVTVALQNSATKTPVKSALSKADGSFEFVVPAGKTYQVVLAFIGYNNKLVPVNGDGPVINLGNILFSSSSKQLAEVNVTAVKPVMRQEVDRIAYDVQAAPDSKAVTALDMMRKVPLLSVDADDAIKLKGSGSYKILVNGRESALMAKNPSDVLKAMPATNIERIEVITTPPAKYDAEGLAGIINIITKTNADQGYNIGVNARYNTVWGTGFNLNGTVKQGKFGYAGYAGYGTQPNNTNPFDNKQNRFADNSVLFQNGLNTFNGHYFYNENELSFEVDTLNLISASFEIYRDAGDASANQLSQLSNSANTVTQQYRQFTNTGQTNMGIDAAFNYQLGFKKSKEQLLTLSYKFSYSPGKRLSDIAFGDLIGPFQQDFTQSNREGAREHTVQLDYVQPFKKVNIEGGAKAILRNNFSEFYVDTLGSDDIYTRNQSQSNVFDYQQDVYSVYNSYQLKMDKWSAKGGLRLEYTGIDATFAAGQPFNTNYKNLIPSVSIQRKFKSSSLNAGYTQRIRRPGIYQLNPFTDNNNRLFTSTGNPNLKPELSNSFELTYSNFSKGSINIGLSYAFSNSAIQSVTSYRDTVMEGVTQKITATTYQNIGSNKTLGLNVNSNLDLTKKLSISLNGQVSRIWLSGYYNDKLYNNAGIMGNAFANVSYKFGDSGYKAGLNAGFFSGNVTLQGSSRYFMFNSYVVTKEFMNKNASISLVANNPYGKYWSRTSTTNTPDFSQVSNYNQFYRHFAIRVNYKFGKLNGEIKKNQRGINNDDTSGSNKSTGNG